MSDIIDHSIGVDLIDYRTWLDNFSGDEIYLTNLDDINLSGLNQEILMNLKKSEDYNLIIKELDGASIRQIYSWLADTQLFPLQIEIENYGEFLREFIPYYVMARNSWSSKQFAVEFNHYIELGSWEFDSKRLRKCKKCGNDLSDEFAVKLTANDILDKKPIVIVCTHCNTPNEFYY